MELNWNQHGLIPAVAQDWITKEVLMLAYMNQESFDKTLETGKAHYYSRSRKKLWLKGETSGHFQFVKRISYDCDEDALLLMVEQVGSACHTGNRSCFYRFIEQEEIQMNQSRKEDKHNVLKEVYEVILERKALPKEGSYTNYLLDKGLDKTLKKVGEESAEVIIASKNTVREDLINEVADLMYHLSVMMVQKDIQWDDVFNELAERRQ